MPEAFHDRNLPVEQESDIDFGIQFHVVTARQVPSPGPHPILEGYDSLPVFPGQALALQKGDDHVHVRLHLPQLLGRVFRVSYAARAIAVVVQVLVHESPAAAIISQLDGHRGVFKHIVDGILYVMSVHAASEKLVDGANQIAYGAEKLSDGSKQLYDGSEKLGGGMKTLDNGAEKLYKGLSDGAEKASETSLSEYSKEMFASPVQTHETQISTVENNGSAMAAYMMCAGLWVAALAFGVLINVEKDPERIREDINVRRRRVLQLIVFAIGSGAILVTLLMLINGMRPAYVGRTFALAIMTSLSFTCIIYLFNVLMGKIGSFLLIIILVLQLGSAGGTYPLDLSPSIYRAMNPFFPFSYAVEGFRRTIATGQDITKIMFVLAAFAIVSAALSIIVSFVKVKHYRQDRFSFEALMDKAFS